jgi:hypothetical protein
MVVNRYGGNARAIRPEDGNRRSGREMPGHDLNTDKLFEPHLKSGRQDAGTVESRFEEIKR